MDSDNEEDLAADEDGCATAFRRGQTRACRYTSSYKGMVGMISTMDADSEFLATMDEEPTKFSFSSAYSYLASTSFLSEEDTIENTHPCAFISKAQTHQQDNPTYKDILRGTALEKQLWDAAMVQELKSLAGLGSFEMVPRPRGANVLQSTCAFKRKRYPDGLLKKYKARFCVRGYQQVEGVYVLDTYVPVV